MEQLGIPFAVVDPGEVEGNTSPNPVERTKENAVAKAREVANGLGEGLVIGADTVVVRDGEILGKPSSLEEARGMLRKLRGGLHTVVSGVALVDAGTGGIATRAVETVVWMRDLTDEEVDAYIETGESLGKAGSYAIQGLGQVFIERIEGCYTNVVGLPLPALYEMLREKGVYILYNKRG